MKDVEAELVERARRGDRDAIRTLLVAHQDTLRAFIRLRIGEELRRKESASDIVQSVCREVLEDLDHFDYRSEQSFRGWLFHAALNKIREKGRFHRAQRRDARRERPLPESQDSANPSPYAGLGTPSHVMADREAIERIEAAFDQLNEDAREVITLSRIARLSHREIAERMGRSEAAVRTLLSRSLARLATLLDEP